MSETTHPVTQDHIPGDVNLSLYYISPIIHILEQVCVRKLPSMFGFNK